MYTAALFVQGLEFRKREGAGKGKKVLPRMCVGVLNGFVLSDIQFFLDWASGDFGTVGQVFLYTGWGPFFLSIWTFFFFNATTWFLLRRMGLRVSRCYYYYYFVHL